MRQTSSLITDANPADTRRTAGKSSISRLRWLLVLLVVVGTTAAAVQWQRKAQSRSMAMEEQDPLHGDSETASGALSSVLDKTPEAQRLPLLLKNAADASPGLRYAAIDALGEQPHTPAVADVIEHAYTDSASTVRQRVLESLSSVDKTRGLRLLLTGLRDEDTWMREAAIQQLSLLPRTDQTAARQCVPALMTALSDSSTTVQFSSAALLAKITRQPWRIRGSMTPPQRAEVVTKWQQWWTGHSAEWPVAPDMANLAPIHPARTDPAPEFSLPDVEGNTVSLASQRGRVTLLNFWGTWCAPCQQEIPDLVRLDEAYRSRGVDVVGVALSESDGANGLKQWCKTHHVAYRQTLATDAMTDAFGHIEEVPVSVLLDGQGRIRYRWEGERDFGTFQAAVDRLLAETPAK